MKFYLARVWICLLLVGLTGCARQFEFYKAVSGPVSPAPRDTVTGLDFPGIGVALSMAPHKNRVGMTLFLTLPDGESFQFESDKIRLEVLPAGDSYVGQISQFRFSHYGRGGKPGYFEYFSPTAALKGAGRHADLITQNTQYLRNDMFMASNEFAVTRPARVRLHFPVTIRNGKSFRLNPIEFVLAETTTWTTNIQ